MSDNPKSAYEKIKAVKDAHQSELMSKPNVVGVGVGLREKAGQLTQEVALVVMVRKKVPLETLGAKDRIPAQLGGVPVDVQEVGELKAQ
jgi:hypothetical protein